MDDAEKLEKIRWVVRGVDGHDKADKGEAYEAIAAILREDDPADSLVPTGVTAERVAALRSMVDSKSSSCPDVSMDALREALHFYDLVRKAWVGAQEEYNELYDGLNAVIADAAILISEGFDEEARNEWLGRREVNDARKAVAGETAWKKR